MIRDNILKLFVKELKNVVKSEGLSYAEAERIKNRVRGLTNALQSLLRDGYELRKTADYEPEERVIRART